jgi:hypothetical protein
MAILFTFIAVTRAQVAPAAKGPPGLPVSGTLRYDLRYSQTAQFYGGAGGDVQMSIASGDASYANTSKRLPFSMQYGGGYGWTLSSTPSAGNVFQHLSVSQGKVWRKSNFTASDNISYTFETPTTGFSGIPGTGEPIGVSGSITTPDQTILTLNTRSLDNITTIGFGQRLNYAMTLNLGGSWGEMRFIDNNGLNTETLMANAGLTRRLDARDSVSGQYSFSRFDYSGAGYTTQNSTAQFGVTRQWNQKLTTTASVGPAWITSSGIPITGSIALPNLTTLFFSATVNYQMMRGSSSLSYSHGNNGGAGYYLGAKVDSINANFSRAFGKNLNVGVTGSYMRTTSLLAAELEYACSINNVTYICLVPLNLTPVTDARFGGVQATRNLGRYFNVFANYTAIDQSSNMQISAPNTPLSSNTTILNGLNQVISFGIGYSPREIHLRK